MLYTKCRTDGECQLCPFSGKSVVYGPFPSRRRGISLGISVFVGTKVCSFNCVYCFRGKTQIKVHRIEDVPPEIASRVTPEILMKALNQALSTINDEIVAIDFSGCGEPTLHPRFSDLVRTVREFIMKNRLGCEVGLFTNASTLNDPRVLRAVKNLDYVEAKLDTVISWKFKALNRPHRLINIEHIVRGIKELRRKFKETLVVQIMLLRYGKISNASERDAVLMLEVLKNLDPDRVDVYTVYRIPRLTRVTKVDPRSIEEYARILRSGGLNVRTFY